MVITGRTYHQIYAGYLKVVLARDETTGWNRVCNILVDGHLL